MSQPTIKMRDMRKIIIPFLFLLLAFGSEAQTRLIGERSVYTQYFLSPFLLNPGAAGQNEYSQVLANYRNTWASFPGSPRTITISYDGPIGNRIGLGLIGVTDSYAAFSTSKGGINLSYAIESPTNKIGVGIGAEFVQHKLRSEELVGLLVDTRDPQIVNRLDGITFFDASFGVYGTYNNTITYGITLPSVISQKISGNEGTSADADFGYIASLAYRYEVPGKDIVFEPSIYAKQLMLVPFHVDINARADFLDEQLTTGLTYSVGAEERVGFLIGARVNNLGFYYSYNMSMHQFQQNNNGSHELSLKLRFQAYNNGN